MFPDGSSGLLFRIVGTRGVDRAGLRGLIPRCASTTDLAIRLSTTRRSSPFLTNVPGMMNTLPAGAMAFRTKVLAAWKPTRHLAAALAHGTLVIARLSIHRHRATAARVAPAAVLLPSAPGNGQISSVSIHLAFYPTPLRLQAWRPKR
jgi:hypothetical protein